METKVIEIHVHFGAPEDAGSGCYWSKKFERMPAYYFMLLLTSSLFHKMNVEQVKKHLFNKINGSKHVTQCVLLAMDEVYTEAGEKKREWTNLHVPNKYIVKLKQENERILFGASVHPFRKDWNEELDFCLDNRAVLCKWVPSSQMIDPSNHKIKPFYQKLAAHHLPLLCHAGPEYAIPTHDAAFNKFNNPKYLRLALDLGVTVIIAHCALPYFGFLDTDYQDDLDDFYRLFQEAESHHWKLYADLSAVATPLRAPYLKKIAEQIPHERLLFGSDYPIPTSELSFTKSKNIVKWLKLFWQAIQIKNPLDKNFQLIKNMGLAEVVFTNPALLFSKIVYH